MHRPRMIEPPDLFGISDLQAQNELEDDLSNPKYIQIGEGIMFEWVNIITYRRIYRFALTLGLLVLMALRPINFENIQLFYQYSGVLPPEESVNSKKSLYYQSAIVIPFFFFQCVTRCKDAWISAGEAIHNPKNKEDEKEKKDNIPDDKLIFKNNLNEKFKGTRIFIYFTYHYIVGVLRTFINTAHFLEPNIAVVTVFISAFAAVTESEKPSLSPNHPINRIPAIPYRFSASGNFLSWCTFVATYVLAIGSIYWAGILETVNYFLGAFFLKKTELQIFAQVGAFYMFYINESRLISSRITSVAMRFATGQLRFSDCSSPLWSAKAFFNAAPLSFMYFLSIAGLIHDWGIDYERSAGWAGPIAFLAGISTYFLQLSLPDSPYVYDTHAQLASPVIPLSPTTTEETQNPTTLSVAI